MREKNIYYASNAGSKTLLIRFITKFVGLLAKILYRPRYHNQHYIPLHENYMLLGNHHSNMDPVFIHLGMPDFVYWVAKEELFKVPILSYFLKKLEVISLKRGEVDLSAMKQIISCLKEEKIIGLFPQGGRVDWDNYQKIMPQSGVASICIRYKSTIVPFYCDGPYKIFRKNNFFFGPPYCLNPNLQSFDKNEKHQKLAVELLRRSYNIVNLPYEIEDHSSI